MCYVFGSLKQRCVVGLPLVLVEGAVCVGATALCERRSGFFEEGRDSCKNGVFHLVVALAPFAVHFR